jgi:hypothetical protein
VRGVITKPRRFPAIRVLRAANTNRTPKVFDRRRGGATPRHARWHELADENEGRYYITPQSVMRAIEEEKAKQPPVGTTSAPNAELPNHSATKSRHEADDSDQVKELERQNRDLQITTRAKDLYLEQLQKEHTQFVEQLVGIGRYVGELETQLLQLGGAPRSSQRRRNWVTCECRRATDSKLLKAIEQASTASASTTNGASASCGKTDTHTGSKSSITTKQKPSP